MPRKQWRRRGGYIALRISHLGQVKYDAGDLGGVQSLIEARCQLVLGDSSLEDSIGGFL